MGHKEVSFIKSGLRVVGLLILPKSIFTGAMFLIVAEILGVVEELV